MAFNFYDTHTLLASVQQLPPLHSFLLDRYFPTNAASDVFATDDVLVEYRKGSKKAAPIAAVLCVLMFVTMLCKTVMNKTVVISHVFILIGFCLGYICLVIHEWLHGIVYPRNALVTIGKITGKISFVALASYPLKRRRFIVMCLLPFVLGIIPLLIFIVSPAEYRELNGLMFGMSCMGMVSPFPDVYNVFIVLKNANKKDAIMFYKNDMYKVS